MQPRLLYHFCSYVYALPEAKGLARISYISKKIIDDMFEYVIERIYSLCPHRSLILRMTSSSPQNTLYSLRHGLIKLLNVVHGY